MARRKPVDTSPVNFSHNGRVVARFRPTGALRPNLELWSSTEPIQAARLFVGFNVEDEPMWSLGRVMELVKDIRSDQGQRPDASFLYQRGYYTHELGESRGAVLVEEDGAQIIVLNTFETPPKTFEKQMKELADKLAYAMEQKEVIVEFQRGGRTYDTVSMGMG
jgi:hypothetical protein